MFDKQYANRFSILLFILLNACQPAIIKPSHPLLVDAPDQQRGVVIIRVVSNTDQLNQFFTNWNRLIVQRKDEETGELFTIKPIETGWSTTALFVGTLPAGDYTAVSLRAVSENTYSSAWRHLAFPESLKHFKVSGAEYTDLGVLVYQPLTLKEPKRNVSLLYTDTGQVNTAALVGQLFPEIAESVDDQHISTWTQNETTQPLQLSAKHRRLIHRAAAINGAPSEGPDGQILIPARLGQIHIRDSNGIWSSHDTGFRFALHNVRYHPDIGYLATGESSIILYTPSLDKPWQAVPGGALANGTAINLIQGQDGQWYQSILQGNEVSELDWLNFNRQAVGVTRAGLYTTEQPTSGLWHEIGLPEAGGVIRSFGQSIYFQSQERTVFQLQKHERSWQPYTELPFSQFTVLSDHTLVSYKQGYQNQIGQLAINSDAKRWQILDQLYFSSLPIKFDDALYAVARGPITAGNTTVPALKAKLYKNNANNTKWHSTADVPLPCTLNVSLYTLHRHIWAVCSGNQVFRLSSGRWITEWQPDIDTSQFIRYTTDQRSIEL